MSLIAFCCLNSSATEAQQESRYKEAYALYRQGPAQASRVIELLEAELNENPSNIEAFRLLAITYFGTKQFDKAITIIDKAYALDQKEGRLNPSMQFLKARALHYTGHNIEAKQLLIVWNAYFLDDEKKEKEFRALLESIEKQIPNQPSEVVRQETN